MLFDIPVLNLIGTVILSLGVLFALLNLPVAVPMIMLRLSPGSLEISHSAQTAVKPSLVKTPEWMRLTQALQKLGFKHIGEIGYKLPLWGQTVVEPCFASEAETSFGSIVINQVDQPAVCYFHTPFEDVGSVITVESTDERAEEGTDISTILEGGGALARLLDSHRAALREAVEDGARLPSSLDLEAKARSMRVLKPSAMPPLAAVELYRIELSFYIALSILLVGLAVTVLY